MKLAALSSCRNTGLTIALGIVFLFGAPALQAKKKHAAEYTETATVLSHTHDGGHFYRIATDRLVYSLSCDKVKHYQMRDPQCMVEGRPIAVGDTIQFRIDDGDQVYLPPAEGSMEQELQILSTELKTAPEPPQAASDGSIRGVVAGTTLTAGKNGGAWYAAPGPVMAVPVTGGGPLLMTPTAPSASPVITGIPVAGGPPLVATQVGGTGGYVGSAKPKWNSGMRLVTAGSVYELQCPGDPCQHDGSDIHPGDALTIRIENKTVWVSTGGANFIKKEKFKIAKVEAYSPSTAPGSR